MVRTSPPHQANSTLGVARHVCRSAAFTAIPTIDIGALVSSDSSTKDRQAVGKLLDEACTTVGFFYVKNHGVPDDIVHGVRQQARRFFEQPDTIKHEIALSPATNYRGYQSLGSNVTRYETGFQRDWHEAIDLYHEPSPEPGRMPRDSAIHGHNRWPSQGSALQQAVEDYTQRMSAVGAAIMCGIALGLGLPEHFFRDRDGGFDPYWCMRIIHYPPLTSAEPADPAHNGGAAAGHAASDGVHADTAQQALAGAELPRSTQLSCGEHTDYGMLTLVNQDTDIAALQVKNSDGEWLMAAPVPGTFVCNVGDMMRVWTNGRYTPTLHRVVNADRTRSRISIPFFHEPAFGTVVEPAVGLDEPGRGPLFEPKEYGAHLESKVFSNFEL
eukprot:jgi/Ulvmu1/377/UM001_0384.1